MANYISRLGAYEFYFSSFNIIKADIDKITSYQNSNTVMSNVSQLNFLWEGARKGIY